MSAVRNLFYLTSFVLCLSCAKQDSSKSSKITLQMPKAMQEKAGDVQGFSSSACFAVSIRGENLPEVSPSSCDGRYGLFAGLVPAGGSIELETTFGQNRTIDIYYVVSDQGCNPIDISKGLGEVFGSNKVHRISRTEGVQFDKPEVVVEVNIDWPKRENSLAQLLTLPQSCIVGEDPLDLMAIRQASLVQGSVRGVTQNGSQVHVRVIDQKLDMKSPNNWTGRILPVRLGEEQ